MSFFTRFINSFKGKTVYIAGAGMSSSHRSRAIEDNEACTAIIDCNATHIARGQALHVVMDENGRIRNIKRNSAYSRLFQKPNPYMTRQDFLYAMAWQMQLTNMAYAWIKWDAMMQPLEVWPLVYFQTELRQRKDDGGYVVQFRDNAGVDRVIPVEDLVIVRRKFDASEFSAKGNAEISSAIDMSNAVDEGLIQTLKLSNKLNGILKHTKAMLKNEQDPAETKRLLEKVADNGGFLELDAFTDYQEIKASGKAVAAAQIKQITDRIYTYWRTPWEVVNNTASEQMMQNYYDSVIEPVWEELSEAFTNALFTRREQGFGNRILVMSGATTGASWQTKLSIVRDTKEQGLLTINEQRELLGYGPVEDGDDRLVSLNYIKSTDQSKYQTGADDNSNKGGNEDGGSNKGSESGQSDEQD